MKVGVAVVEVVAGLHATAGVQAALRQRDATGVGQRVEVDLLPSLLSGLVNQASSYLTAGVVPGRLGDRHPYIAPYELFITADRPMVVAVGSDEQFVALCRSNDAPSLAGERRYRSNSSRVWHVDELAATLSRFFVRRTAAAWVDLLTLVGAPCGLINKIDEAFALVGRLGLHPSQDLCWGDGPTGLRLPSKPVRRSATRSHASTPPPALGQASAWIRSWLRDRARTSRY